MTIKDRLDKLERENKLLLSLTKKLVTKSKTNKAVLAGGYNVSSMYNHIKKCIRDGNMAFIYGLNINFGTNPKGFGELQNDYLRTEVSNEVCNVMNNESDTIAGSLSLGNSKIKIIIGIITIVDSSDYIQKILDDSYHHPEEIHIGETIIYPDDTLTSVLARLEYAYYNSEASYTSNYTRIYKNEK